ERISEETGCWLAFMARHATGPAVTHFSSSRLRRDARPDATDLVNRFSNITSALLVAKRDEALKLAKQLEEAEARKQAADAEILATRKALVSREAEIAEKDALIIRYKAQYGCDL
ncbi:hypothetical protein BD779DRAFT_1458133, partial [Infundibulicybe gibba]